MIPVPPRCSPALWIASLLLPALSPTSLGAPDEIIQDVTLGEETLTMRLTRLDLRGPNFDFRSQDAQGSIRTLNPVPERSYLGSVDDRPGAVSCGIQLDDGTFKGAILFERGMTWYTQGENVSRTQATDYEDFIDYQFPTGATISSSLGGVQMHGFDLGVDVSNGYYTQTGAQTTVALERVEFTVNLIRAIYMRDALIRPYLGRVILRTAVSRDPYNGSSGWFNMMSRARTEWNSNQADAIRQLVTVVGGGGFRNGWSWNGVVGTGNGYSSVQSGPAGDFDDALRRQLGFNWSSTGNAGGNPEGLGIMGTGGPARMSGSEAFLILNHRNQRASAGVIRREARFNDVELPPYASMDTLRFQRSMTGSVLVSDNHPVRVTVPVRNLGDRWQGGNEPFNDRAWTLGANGVGYERNTNNNNISYSPFIKINVGNEMASRTNCFIRIPFTVEKGDLEKWNRMILKMRYDDGFIAYLNGREVSSANAPENANHLSLATTTTSDSAAILYQDFNISSHLDALKSGENILAIHGLNESTSSSDFLIQAKLVAGLDAAEPSPPTRLAPLANDHDANGQRLTISAFDSESTAGGTVTQERVDLIYTPPANLSGLDWFHYTAADSTGRTGTGVVLVDGTPTLENLDLNPASRQVSASGGSFILDVDAPSVWSWRRDPANGDWLRISEPITQSRAQVFSYEVRPNPSPDVRRAEILFLQGDTERIHIITQAGNPDAHGNTIETASLLDLDSSLPANLDIPGDVDFFRIEVDHESFLTLETTGETDTRGTLFDSSGTFLTQNNNANGLNFRINYRVLPGTYHLRVSSGLINLTGQYTLTGSLTFIPRLRILSTRQSEAETTVSLIFSTMPGQSYRLERSRNLLDWEDVLEDPIVAETTTVEESYTFDTSANPRLFLRVRQE